MGILQKKANRKTSIIYLITGILFFICIIELLLQILALAIPKLNFILVSDLPYFEEIKDEKLGIRGNLAYPGHDKNGFRNNSIPLKAYIICMGDSQTYGLNVSPDRAWPQQLEKMSGLKVYNMAFGGYSPAHSLILLNKAIELKPKLIIEAFYSGNDAFEAYELVYNRGELKFLINLDKKVIKEIMDTESKGRLEDKIQYNFTKTFYRDKKGQIIKFLVKNSKLYSLLQAIKRLSSNFLNNRWIYLRTKANKEFCQVFDSGKLKTVFTPRLRLCGLDLSDPRIAEGHRICLEAIRLMNEQAKLRDINVIVLFIPTKEMAFEDAAKEKSSKIIKDYDSLIKNEKIFWKTTMNFLKKHKIDFIDSLPYLRDYIKNGDQPYKISQDGHPNKIGYYAIAEAVYAVIKNKGLLVTN